jgi:hypothetical protein
MSYPPENNIPAPPIFQDQKFQMSRFQGMKKIPNEQISRNG